MSHVGEGYTHCACRDCFEITIGTPGKELCHKCSESGCTIDEGECQVLSEDYDAIECGSCGKHTLPVDGEVLFCPCGALLSTD